MPWVINNFFKNQTVVVLELDPKKLTGPLKYEKNPGGEVKFPHLYAKHIATNAITTWEVINPVKVQT